jgi:hypothetical protein
MRMAHLLRLVLIAALIGFTARADAACLTTGTMPSVQHAADCADMAGGDHKGKPTPDTQAASRCPFACVALASAIEPRIPNPRHELAMLEPKPSLSLIGIGQRPPVPPPRFFGNDQYISI